MAVVVFTGVLIMTGCDSGNDDSSNPTSVPNAPAIEDIQVENRLISILWYVVEGADSYNLYWNTTGSVTTSDNSYTDLQTPYNFISFSHSGLSFFKTHYYRLTAVNVLGESSLSSEVSALPAVTIGELWKRAASDYEDGDEFGRSVSISGDYLIAGAPYEDEMGLDSGAIYLYNRDYGATDAWGVIAKRTASDAAAGDSFGHSVSISGDHVVVGAPNKDGLGADEGAAYVFARDQGGTDAWGEVVILTASDAAAGDSFGHSVSVSGDYVVVGANRKGGVGTDRGAAYVYYRDQGGPDAWGEVVILTASDPADSDYFGSSVSISGDYILVGAPYEDGDDTGTDQGAAYVYYRNQDGPDVWGEVMKLISGGPEDDDLLGYSVAISDHFAITGVPGEDGVPTVTTDIGAMSIF